MEFRLLFFEGVFVFVCFFQGFVQGGRIISVALQKDLRTCKKPQSKRPWKVFSFLLSFIFDLRWGFSVVSSCLHSVCIGNIQGGKQHGYSTDFEASALFTHFINTYVFLFVIFSLCFFLLSTLRLGLILFIFYPLFLFFPAVTDFSSSFLPCSNRCSCFFSSY